MKMINEPANTDYLFICTQKYDLTSGSCICARVRMGGTYQTYNFLNQPENSSHYIYETLDQSRPYGIGFDYDKIAQRINELVSKTNMPIRFSDSMMDHRENLEGLLND